MATTPIFLPRKSHGQRNLAGCSLWGHKESDMTNWVHTQVIAWALCVDWILSYIYDINDPFWFLKQFLHLFCEGNKKCRGFFLEEKGEGVKSWRNRVNEDLYFNIRSGDGDLATYPSPIQLSQLPIHYIFNFPGYPLFKNDSNLCVGLALKISTKS